jgi:hypothetical protein
MSNPEFFIENIEWSKELEKKYQDYMWQCESSIDGEEEDDFVTLSGQPFCGCDTCYTREQLFFLTPYIIKGYKNGDVSLSEDTDEK